MMTDIKFKLPANLFRRQFFLILLISIAGTDLCKAQFGFVAAPYFFIPNFGTECYGNGAHKESNGTVGWFLHLNADRRLQFNMTRFRLGTDVYGHNQKVYMGYGVGGHLDYTYQPFHYSEIQAIYSIVKQTLDGRNDIWGGDRIARTIGIRGGMVQNQRMVQVSPTQVDYNTYDNGTGTWQANHAYISKWDITSLQQNIVYVGITIDKYKRVEHEWSFDFQKTRRRVWQQYADLMIGVSQTYADYGVDSFHFKGSNVKNFNPIGFRIGIRRLTYNILGNGFLFEFGKYPGQGHTPGQTAYGLHVDDNIWKNWFILAGFHLSIGSWFGDYE